MIMNNTPATLWFNVAGTSFRKDQLDSAHKHYLQRKTQGKSTDIILVPEPDNKYDPNAIKVCVFLPPDHIFFGYVPKKETGIVCDWRHHYPHHTIRIAYMGDNRTGTGNIGCIVELKEAE